MGGDPGEVGLGFDHPASGERMNFEAPIPDDFTPWLQLLPQPLT